MTLSQFKQPNMTLSQRLWQINWAFVLLLTVTASIGFSMLYSAANGSFDPWAVQQMMRFSAGILLMLTVAVIDIHVWLRYAYAVYAIALGLLTLVEFFGSTGMGAQRWIDLGFITFQPSELMKIAIILVVARYFYASRLEDVKRISHNFPPILML